MDHGVKNIAFYVKKHTTPCTVVITSLLVCDKPLGVPVSVKYIYLTDDSAPDKQEAKTKANADSCQVNSVLFYLSQNLVIGGRTYAATDSKYVKLIESQQSL